MTTDEKVQAAWNKYRKSLSDWEKTRNAHQSTRSNYLDATAQVKENRAALFLLVPDLKVDVSP